MKFKGTDYYCTYKKDAVIDGKVVWSVISRSSGRYIGCIKWGDIWNRYSFTPDTPDIGEHQFGFKILNDLAQFCFDQTILDRVEQEVSNYK